MQSILDRVAARVERAPGWVLTALLAVTVALGLSATRLETVTDIAVFAGDTAEAQAFEELETDLEARTPPVLVVVDAGAGGDVLTPEGVDLADRLASRIADDAVVAEHLAPARPGMPSVPTYAAPVLALVELLGEDVDALGPDLPDAFVEAAFALPGAEAADALLADGASDGAAAGAVLVPLRPGTEPDARVAVSDAVAAIVDDLAADAGDDGFVLHAFSRELLEQELDDLLQSELPLLAGLSMALIVAVLVVAFRRPSDVLVAVGGLLVTLVWMAGLIALLGPRGLGVTGHFTQIGLAVPVLLIGLGVDYSIHLTFRHREERQRGRAPAAASAEAVRTVGRALVLVTITTVIGFLANLVSPVPPIRDFALFTASGVVGAMVVMGLGVPSARAVLDRKARRQAAPAPVPGRVANTMAGVAGVSARHPFRTLGAVSVVVGLGVAGALDLGTEFSQDEFVPDDARVATTMAVLDERFGGNVAEETYVVFEADLTEPEVANAVLDLEDRLAEVELVASADGRARARSAPGAARTAVELADELAAFADANGFGLDAVAAEGLPDLEAVVGLASEVREAGFAEGRFAEDADVTGAYRALREQQPAQVGPLRDDGRGVMVVETRAGEERAPELQRAIDDRLDDLRALSGDVVVTSQPILVDQTLDALVESQAQKVVVTTAAALLLLSAYFGLRHRRPALGALTMLPTIVALVTVLGCMWLVGLSFNPLTAMITSVAIGFGVDYGIHVTNRFLEDRDRAGADAAAAIRRTITHTGTALVASATTTAAAFAVLLLSGFVQLRQFGGITALTMVFALLATLVAQSSALVLWARRSSRTV